MHNKNNEQFSTETEDDVEEKQRQTPGIMLRKARRDRGLSEEEVCHQLGLTSRLFKALEADDFARLPAPTYVRGYIRRYASLVGVSADEIITSFEVYYKEVVGEPESPEPVSTKTVILWRRRIFWLILIGVLLVVSLWLAWLFSGTTEASTYQESAIESEAVVPPMVTPGHIESLPMVFDRAGWAEVVDAKGDILLAAMVTPGRKVVVAGVPPFKVRLSGEKGVKMNYAGRSVEVK